MMGQLSTKRGQFHLPLLSPLLAESGHLERKTRPASPLFDQHRPMLQTLLSLFAKAWVEPLRHKLQRYLRITRANTR